MQHSVRPTFLIFFGGVLAVCAWSAVVVFNWIVRKLKRTAWPPRWLAIGARAAVLTFAACAALGMFYAVFVEPNWPAVEHVRLESDKLPPGARPIRIVQVSDLHCEGTARLEERLPDMIAAEKPDLIVFTGDAVNGAEGIPVFNRFIRRVAKLAPTFVIYGNNHAGPRESELMEGAGVREVMSWQAEIIEIRGVTVRVVASAWARHNRVPKAAGPFAPEMLTILLCQSPGEGAKVVAGSGVDLCLAGDTHGGQVRLPFYGAVGGSERDRKYLAGLYRVDDTWLYVNRGIGMHNPGPPMRFGARPEITVVDISPGAETSMARHNAKQKSAGKTDEPVTVATADKDATPKEGVEREPSTAGKEKPTKAATARKPVQKTSPEVPAPVEVPATTPTKQTSPKEPKEQPQKVTPKPVPTEDTSPPGPPPPSRETPSKAPPVPDTPKAGTLVIESSPAECIVHIPGAELNQERKKQEVDKYSDIPPGKHHARFTASGKTLSHTIDVAPGAKIRLLVDFDRGTVVEETTVGLRRTLDLDLGGRVRMKLVRVPAGKFMMGSPASEKGRSGDEGPCREVRISKPFYAGVTEVTQSQLAAFVRESGYMTSAQKRAAAGRRYGSDSLQDRKRRSYRGFVQPPGSPVVSVSWNDAMAFCKWLSRRSDHNVRLPTEAQWEYACRAGTKTAYQWGDDPAAGRGWCNAADQAGKKVFPTWKTFRWQDGFVFTAPAAEFKANAFGLHDMHGNVWEWCNDWYGEKYYGSAPRRDPLGPATGKQRVLRGGSWTGGPQTSRSASRFRREPNYWDVNIGFRVTVDANW